MGVQWFGKQRLQEIEQAAARAATTVAKSFRRDLVRVLGRQGTGQTYEKDGQLFRGARDGAPPAKGKGIYLRSIRVRAATTRKPAITYTNEKIGSILEFGDHPHFRPVFEQNRTRYVQQFKTLMRMKLGK